MQTSSNAHIEKALKRAGLFFHGDTASRQTVLELETELKTACVFKQLCRNKGCDYLSVIVLSNSTSRLVASYDMDISLRDEVASIKTLDELQRFSETNQISIMMISNVRRVIKDNSDYLIESVNKLVYFINHDKHISSSISNSRKSDVFIAHGALQVLDENPDIVLPCKIASSIGYALRSYSVDTPANAMSNDERLFASDLSKKLLSAVNDEFTRWYK